MRSPFQSPLSLSLWQLRSPNCKAILDYSNQNGYASYATLGYDGSMPGVGVAWIKLLDLPEEYKQFIKDHQVEEVYIYGVGQEGHGESYSRRVLTQNTITDEYAPGSFLYIEASGKKIYCTKPSYHQSQSYKLSHLPSLAQSQIYWLSDHQQFRFPNQIYTVLHPILTDYSHTTDVSVRQYRHPNQS